MTGHQANESSPLLNDGDPSNSAASPSDCSTRLKGFCRCARLRDLRFFLCGLLISAIFIVSVTWVHHDDNSDGNNGGFAPKRNLVFMVSDGMGPATLTLTRNYRQYVENLPNNDILVLDQHFWGTSRTQSSDALVTDSAAGATAFSCSKKSYNGAISVTPDKQPCGSVLEAAKRAGYHTGLVATTYVTDATPACFASHVLHREFQGAIAMQEIGENVLGRSVDIILGGGRCWFLPNTTDGSCRADNIDVSRLAQEKHGWTYTDSRTGFNSLNGGNKVQLPHLGLYAPRNIPFEIDRRNQNDVYPSLSEMATTALRALEKATENSDKGFFIMIEGSRIDHAGHNNDPAAQVHEVLEYDKTFKAVLDFIKNSKTETVLVSTSDHETGGLATAIQEPGHLPVYNWYPAALANATASCEWLALKLQAQVAKLGPAHSKRDLKRWINENLIIPGLGIPNAKDEELEALATTPELSGSLLAAMISLHAHVGWSSGGHTAVDVNIYSSGGPGTERLRRNVENIEVGGYLSYYLDVDLEEITRELKEKKQTTSSVEDLAAYGLGDLIRGGDAYHVEELV